MEPARVFTTIDAHAGGEPLRLITSGVPELPGATILERRQFMAEHHDDIRRTLLFEPRGHADMYGAVLTPPVSDEADFGVIFLTNEGYSSMCGHGVVALTTILLERGMVERQDALTEIIFDSPAGLIRASATVDGGRVHSVAFRNVPAFRLAQNLQIVTQRGTVNADVAFGGAFYAIVDAAELGLEVVPEHVDELRRVGMEIKRAVDLQLEVVHPDEPKLHGMYGAIISEGPRTSGGNGRNVTVYAEGAIDRSPCGTGTSAKLACLYADGALAQNAPYVHESIISTTFTGRVLAETTVGGLPAVVTEIAGRGHLTGLHQFIVDPADPTRQGFLVR
jgi:trans-L-3-hydroxyproline dehydratase